MKRRSVAAETPATPPEDSLCRALLALESLIEMRAFLRDLCTPAELEALVDRWRVVPYILQGVAYREIHDRTAVSVTTIGRVARFLQQGNGGYLAAVAHKALPRGLLPARKPLPRTSGAAAKSTQAAAKAGAGLPSKRARSAPRVAS